MPGNARQILTVIVLFIIISFGCSARSEGLKQEDVETLINTFLAMHVSHNTFTDELSARTLDNMISMLDPWKMYFTKSDVDEFMKDRTKIDDYVKNGDFTFIFRIYSTYKKRFAERMNLFNELIKLDYDFTVDEYISVDREKIMFTDNLEEISDRWRKTIKLQLLSYVNSGKSLDDAKKKVIKRNELMQKDMKSLTNERILTNFVNAFGQALDPHTDYMDADEFDDFKISMNLKLEGIGATLRSEDGFTFIDSIMPGGPASKLPEAIKLMPNDKIIAVAQGNNEPEDIIDMPLRDAVKKIRGKKDTLVKLTILRETGKNGGTTSKLIIPIIRDKIVLENQAAKSELFETGDGPKKHRIGYIKLPTFYLDENAYSNEKNARRCSEDLLTEIKKMIGQNAEALIIDLRGNPGGSLPEAIRTASFFVKDGPVLQVKSHERTQVEGDYDAKTMAYDGPVVVLIDRMSASASEIFAGALKDYKRALIVGGRSFGKGSVQNLIPLGGRSGAVKVTIQLFYQPSGNSNHLNGIAPDIAITDLPDILDIGENKLKYPLQWAPIKKVYYTTFGTTYLTPGIVSELLSRSQARTKSDKDFIELGKKLEQYKKKIAEMSINLKKDTVTSDAIADEVEKQQKDKEKRERDSRLIDTKNDILLREAFNITSDYIELLKKNH
jgi:carboxyl-terminal processing protease